MKDQASRLRELVGRSQEVALGSPIPFETDTRVLAVASGKGGVGKSNLVANMSIALSQQGKKVIVLDADLGMANLDILMGLAVRFTLYDVLYGRKRLEEVVIEGPAGVRIIPGGSGMQELANLASHQQERLLAELKKVSSGADFLLIDTGAGISRIVLAFLGAAQEVIIVSTTEPTSITDAYGIIKILARHGDQTSIKTVINRVPNRQEGLNTNHKLQQTAQRFLNLEIENLGYIREDKLLIKAVKEQELLLLKYPYSEAAEDIKMLTGRLLSTAVEKPLGTQKFFQRLQRLFS